MFKSWTLEIKSKLFSLKTNICKYNISIDDSYIIKYEYYTIKLKLSFIFRFRCKLKNLIGTIISREVHIKGGKCFNSSFSVVFLEQHFNKHRNKTIILRI